MIGVDEIELRPRLFHRETLTGTLGVNAPNRAPPCVICHWKLQVPAVAGAVSLKFKATLAPAATGLARSTRFDVFLLPRF